ncbi:hypothetical protein A2U01_0058625, partial [Trifolium medium]|nr:hypothetical protein [Trifolium medium]
TAGAARQSARIELQEFSAICASRRFIWRVAQIHMARRAPSLFITRVA